jgi:predicted transcriptional regulator
MPRKNTSVSLPDELAEALDRRAVALGITRSQLIVHAVERLLAEHAAWSPRFLEAIGRPRPEIEEAVEEMMDAIRTRRSPKRAPER